jgi:hypothetical protein
METGHRKDKEMTKGLGLSALFTNLWGGQRLKVKLITTNQ